MTSLEVLQAFLARVFAGDMDGALALTSPEAVFISVRPEPNADNPMHGTFAGRSGARAFFGAFGEALEPGDFDVSAAFGQGEHVAMYGRLSHEVRATGRPFASDWALIARVENGLLSYYHFYEDSAAFAAAAGA